MEWGLPLVFCKGTCVNGYKNEWEFPLVFSKGTGVNENERMKSEITFMFALNPQEIILM